MFEWVRKGVRKLDQRLNKPLEGNATNLRWLQLEVSDWLASPERNQQINGDKYYSGDQKILYSNRQIIGEDGKLIDAKNLPNHKLIDNQYKKLVNQKANYIVGKPFTVDSENEEYEQILNKYFNKKFMKIIKNVAKDANNGGISYIYPYYQNGKMKFKRFKSYEIKVYWKDTEHDEIDFFIHHYRENIRYKSGTTDIIEHLEVYTLQGVDYYIYKNGVLYPDDKNHRQSYLREVEVDSEGKVVSEQFMNFERIPLIPFKIDETEKPLLNRVKSLQDAINLILSTFQNNMMEDSRNTILILVNYAGENLGEFRRNLSTYGAVNVRSDSSGGGGDLRALQVEVNAENYKLIIDVMKKAIIQNGGGYDITEIRQSGTPNQMNIQSMYSDIELDTNDTETEWQSALEQLLWFINFDINYQEGKDFSDETVDFIFNRDMMKDEATIIDNLMKLSGVITDEDIIKMLPFGNAAKLIENKKKQDEDRMNEYNQNFPLISQNLTSNQAKKDLSTNNDV